MYEFDIKSNCAILMSFILHKTHQQLAQKRYKMVYLLYIYINPILTQYLIYTYRFHPSLRKVIMNPLNNDLLLNTVIVDELRQRSITCNRFLWEVTSIRDGLNGLMSRLPFAIASAFFHRYRTEKRTPRIRARICETRS